jgi:hypothetical protein
VLATNVIDEVFFEKADDKVIAKYEKEAQAKIDKIMSADGIDPATIKGTCYYISSINGDDSNDGLSPQTAWKTINNLYQIIGGGWKINHKCVDNDTNYRCDLCGLITAHDCADVNGNGKCDMCFYGEDHLPGDINGNGTVNMGDVAKLYAHIRATASLNEAELAQADINGDGSINIGDTSKLYRTIRDTFINP